MKTFIPSLLAIFFLISCNSNTTNEGKTTCVIKGKVLEFESVSNHDEITVELFDLLSEPQSKTTKISNKGLFRFELEIDQPTEFILKYSGRLNYLLLPGDSLFFEINNDCWKVTTHTYKDEYAFYKVTGTSQKLNQNVVKFVSLYQDSLYTQEESTKAVKTKEPLEYLEFNDKKLKNIQAALNAFNTKENTSKAFQEWANAFITYHICNQKIGYRFYHAFSINEDPIQYIHKLPSGYFDFLDNVNLEKRETTTSSSYVSFLNDYANYMDQLIPKDSQEVYNANLEEYINKGIPYLTRYYSKTNEGFVRDFLISNVYYRMLAKKYYSELKKVYDPSLIKDTILRQQVQDKFEYEKQWAENPEFAEGTNINKLKNENDFLLALTNTFEGKVIYLDFWAPWCSPCMGEMPYSKNIMEHYNNKDVVFVFLANRCKESGWKATVAEQSIKGEHYLLTDKQFEQLSRIFEIKGIPHYAIIDKKGSIVKPFAPRPSHKSDLISQIDKYLNTNPK